MIPAWLEPFGAWIWDASWHAAVVVAVVLLVRSMAGRRMPAGWRCGLWGLVAIRLVLVWTPQGSWSVFGLLERLRPADHAAAALNTPPIHPGEKADPGITVRYGPAPLGGRVERSLITGAAAKPDAFNMADGMLLCWAVGAVALLLRRVVGWRRLYRRLGCAAAGDAELVLILDRCRREMGVGRAVEVLETDAVAGPSLAGVFRPRILLPAGLCQRLDGEELRFVFLHELAHVRRQDVLVEWGLAILTALHWFNPAVWVAVYFYRADREVARDEMVLRVAGERQRSPYGHTLLRLMEMVCPTGELSKVAIGMLGGKRRLTQRIKMIAGKTSTPARLTLLALVLGLGVVGWMVLTNPKRGGGSDHSNAAHANYWREGTYIIDRTCHLAKSADGRGYEIIFDGGPTEESPLAVLPDERLSQMEAAAAGATGVMRFRVSGMVQKHEGRDSILLEKVVVIPFVDVQLERRLPEINFDGRGLGDAIDFLRDASGANIVVNWRLLEAAGINKDAPVTARMKDVSLSKALKTILADAGGGNAQLSYAADGGVISISTYVELNKIITRIYDIRDLLESPPDFDSDKDHPVGFRSSATRPAAEVPQPLSVRVAAMIKLVRETIDPTSWGIPGRGSIQELNGQLVIAQTAEAHEGIVSLFKQLRETRSLQIQTTARFVVFDPSLLPQDGPDWTAVRSVIKASGSRGATRPKSILNDTCLSGNQTAALLDMIEKQKDGSIRSAPKLTTFDGQRAYVLVHTQRAYVADIKIIRDAEGKIKSYEPIVDVASSGLTVDLQAFVSANRKYVTMSIRPKLAKLLKLHTIPFSKIPPDHPAGLAKPTVQEPEMLTTEAGGAASIPDGQTFVIDCGEDAGQLTPAETEFKPRAGNHLYILVTPHMMLGATSATAPTRAGTLLD